MATLFIKRKIKKREQYLAEYGDDFECLQELAELYLKLAQRDVAVPLYERAIQAYYQDDSRLGKTNEAILELCWKLLELDALNHLAYRTLGQEYCGLSEFETAAKLYKSYANKLLKAERYDDALAQYRNVLVLLPEDINVRQQCVSLLWRLRRKEDTVQELVKIADLSEKAGKIAKALECYKKALRIFPARTEIRAEFSRLLHTSGNKEKQLRLVVNNAGNM